jgi:hypothetical protein
LWRCHEGVRVSLAHPVKGGKMMMDLIKKTMKKMNLATREDMLRLSKRMKKLEQALKEKGQRG